MRYSERFMEHIEYAFNAFCKIVLRHEAINAWRDLKRKEEREISLDYLMSEKYFEPSAMDSYFEKQDKPTVFLVLGKEVIVDDERLATALSRLPKLRQEVLLLYYFLGYRDEAIAGCADVAEFNKTQEKCRTEAATERMGGIGT